MTNTNIEQQITVKGLLTFQDVFLGLRVHVASDLLYDIDKDLLSAGAQQQAERGNYPRIPLVEQGDKLVSQDEISNGTLISTLGTRQNSLISKVEGLLLGVSKPQSEVSATTIESKPEPIRETQKPSVVTAEQPKEVTPRVETVKAEAKAPAKATSKAEAKPKTTKPVGGKAEPKKKTKMYTVLLSVKTMTPDGKGVEDREIKRDFEDTNLTNVRMQAREILAQEHNVPMKDVKVLKAGVKKA